MTLSFNRFIIFFFIFVALSGMLIGYVMFKYGGLKGELKENPLIETKLGPIEGLWANDGDYSMFMGVPYALVNETNPFGPSIPYPEFNKVFKAHNDSPICPQMEKLNHTSVGSLDCLNLNIYVPNSANSNNSLPVLVYIHDSKYESGSADRYLHGPKYFMKQDIILVVINYRIGPYGFLCLNTPDVPGNQGLKDQVAALKWIKENIASFGGDSSKITLSGVSSGGENVYLHLLYEKELLFSQVIIASGLTSPPLIMNSPNLNVPRAIAADLGLITKSMREALSFLATKDTNSIIQSSNKLNITYKPCVEKQFKNIDPFITNYTINMVNAPNVKNVSILLEQTSNERLYIHADTHFKITEYKNIFTNEINSQFNMDNNTLTKMVDYIHRFYVGDDNIGDHGKHDIIDFSSDLHYNYPIRRGIDTFLVDGAKKIYYGVFSYVGERNFMRDLYHVNKSCNGSTHSDDFGYVFDISYMKDKQSITDMLIVERLTTLWANFVKYGDPTPNITQLLPIKWEPVTNNTYEYYDIDREITAGLSPFHERMAFWDLFYKLNGKFERFFNTN